MSDRDDADRLSRSWDDFVSRPHAARAGDETVDPTIREVHAAARAHVPDPEFRAQLRKQLERQAQYRAGQRLGQDAQATETIATPLPSAAPDPLASARRGARPIEILSIAALLALVGAAIFWAVEFRPTDHEPTATAQLAATSPIEVAGTPTLTPAPTVTATDEPTATATEEPSATSEPTATASPSATPTQSPTSTATADPSPTRTPTFEPTAAATTFPVACNALAESYDALLAPIANPQLAPDIASATTADAATIAGLDSAYSGFIGCLSEADQAQRRLDIAESLERSGMTQLDAFRVAQEIDLMVAGNATLSDYRLVDASSAVALLSIDDIPVYRIFFAFDAGEGAWFVSSLAGLVDATATEQPFNPGGISDDSGSNQGTGEGDGLSGSGDDDGSDDDGGDDGGDDGDDGDDTGDDDS